TFEVPRPVAKKVARLRTLVRLYVLAERLAAIVIVAGVGFWMGLAIDWLFETQPAIRVIMWAVVVLFTIGVMWRDLARRCVPRPDDSVAVLVERKYPDLDEGLVTTVQARSAGETRDRPFIREMSDATSRRAAAAMDGVGLRR